MIKHLLPPISAVAALFLSGCAAGHPGPGAPPYNLGNAASGRVYAEQICASCHAVGPSEMRSPDPRARPFEAIANTPGLTQTAVNAWLHSSHTNMPMVMVTPEGADDLYAYLSTLKHRD